MLIKINLWNYTPAIVRAYTKATHRQFYLDIRLLWRSTELTDRVWQEGSHPGHRYQTQWASSLYQLLTHKKVRDWEGHSDTPIPAWRLQLRLCWCTWKAEPPFSSALRWQALTLHCLSASTWGWGHCSHFAGLLFHHPSTPFQNYSILSLSMKLNSLLPFLLSFFTTSSKRFMALVKKPLREREESFGTVSWVSHFPPNSCFSFCKERRLFCSALTGRAAITRVCRVGRSIYGQALSGKLNSFNEK